MKLIHLSDLHLGKRVNEYPMLEDQQHILSQILGIIEDEQPDGVILAGDIYDKAVPSAEAVTLFDDFLYALARLHLRVFVIAGNHDSPERIAFGSRIMDASGIHLSPVYNGDVRPIVLRDEFGSVNIYMLPFIKPAHVRRFYDEEIRTYTDAVRCAIRHMDIDPAARNILVTHQFVTGASRSESEENSVGGSDNVDAGVFEPFDYVALGHIHSPQNCGSDRIRYCGTPLKYSFSEVRHHKSVTVVELGPKGHVELRFLALSPLHDLRELRGTYDELMLRENYEGTDTEDYLRITLTDEEDVPNAVERLRATYPNLMLLAYDNRRTRASDQLTSSERVESMTPMELFSEFFEQQNNQPMDDVQRTIAQKSIEKVWEEDS